MTKSLCSIICASADKDYFQPRLGLRLIVVLPENSVEIAATDEKFAEKYQLTEWRWEKQSGSPLQGEVHTLGFHTRPLLLRIFPLNSLFASLCVSSGVSARDCSAGWECLSLEAAGFVYFSVLRGSPHINFFSGVTRHTNLFF